MGERTTSLESPSDSRHYQGPRASAEQLGNEIAVVRNELDSLLGEFDRRRHEALDVPLQLRRHALGISLTALALVTTAAGSVWLTLWRRRRRGRLAARAGRLRQAVSRMTEHPERVATEPTVTAKIATAAANAAIAVLVKKLLERAVEWVMDSTQDRRSPHLRRSAETVRATEPFRLPPRR
jgi:hypothetical protein